jgi:hypothetical protein
MSTLSHVSSDLVTMQEDGYCYINNLRITGVGWLIRDGNHSAELCIENRVALTKSEQTTIGDSQPFMLEDKTYNNVGDTIDDVVLAQAYINKMVHKGKGVKLSKKVGISMDNVIEQVIIDAKMRSDMFRERRFPMALLREGIKKDEIPFDALKRGIREECKKKFHESIVFIPHKFCYERHGNTCLLIYFIDIDMLIDDDEAISKAGKCNYFCAKSLPDVVDNDYLETRQHEMLSNDEVDKCLIEFDAKFGENGIGCDLKYWGGLKMWQECKKHFT